MSRHPARAGLQDRYVCKVYGGIDMYKNVLSHQEPRVDLAEESKIWMARGTWHHAAVTARRFTSTTSTEFCGATVAC